MGGIPHDNGTAFRVWAPFASAVIDAGRFNDWAAKQYPMQSEQIT